MSFQHSIKKVFFHLVILMSFVLASCASNTGKVAEEAMPMEGDATAEMGDTATAPEGDAFELGALGDLELGPVLTENTSNEMPEVAPENTDSNVDFDAASFDTSVVGAAPEGEYSVQPDAQADSQPAAASVATWTPSVAPEVSNAPVEVNGELLNRFYILRNSDSAEELSVVIYGTSDRADDLKGWNANAKWKAGQTVYYVSPLQPADGEMKSFYQERGIVAQEYEVRPGDSLSSIAQGTYGHPSSWKEISVVNNVANPDRVEVGTRLSLFPVDLSSYALDSSTVPGQATKETASLDEEINDLESEISDLEKELGANAPQKAQEGDEPLIENAKKEDPSLASVEIAQFIQRNIFFILSIGGLLAAILFYMVIRKPKDSDIGGEF